MKMRKQRLIGFGLVLIAVLVIVMASTGGPSPEDQDATAAVLIGPLGLWMMLTKSYVSYDREPEPRTPDRRADRRKITFYPGENLHSVLAKSDIPLRRKSTFQTGVDTQARDSPRTAQNATTHNTNIMKGATPWQGKELSKPQPSKPGRT